MLKMNSNWIKVIEQDDTMDKLLTALENTPDLAVFFVGLTSYLRPITPPSHGDASPTPC